MSVFKPEDLSALGLAIRLALALALPPVTGLLLGLYVGRIVGKEALLIGVGIIFGLWAGFRQAMKLLIKK